MSQRRFVLLGTGLVAVLWLTVFIWESSWAQKRYRLGPGSPELQMVAVGMTETEVETLFRGRKGEPFDGEVGTLHFVEYISLTATNVHRSLQWSGCDGLLVVDFDDCGKVVGRRFFVGNLF